MAWFGKKLFISWLEGFNPRKVVGKARDCRCCPIAQFIIEKGPYKYVEVSPYNIELYNNIPIEGSGEYSDRAITPPPWATAFINSTDNNLSRVRVTASSALKTIREI